MRNRERKILSALLAALMLLHLAACGREQETAEEPDRYGGIRYIPAFQTLDTDVDEFRGGCVMGDYVYLAGSAVTNEDYDDRESRLLRVSLEDGAIEALPGCEPPGGDRNVITSSECLAIAAGEEETLWLFECVRRWFYDFPEDFNPYNISAGTRGKYYTGSNGSYVLHRLDTDGNELFRQEWPVNELESRLGVDDIDEVFISAGGDAAVWDRWGTNRLVTMDKTGAPLGEVSQADTDLEWYGVVRLGDGRLAVYGFCQENGESRTGLRALSREGGAWEESWTLPAWTSVYGGDANAPFYYNEGQDLMAWRDPAPAGEAEAAENTPLLSWVNIGMDSGGNRTVSAFLPDGRLAVVQGGSRWSNEPAELAVLTPTDDPPEKTVLTLGTVGLYSGMEKMVRAFNRTNPDYQIEVRDYTDYGSGFDREAAMTRLAAEIGAGRVPDILDTYLMPLADWASSGLLEDLWPWIDLDRDIGREDLMLRVLEADSMDGKLYEIGDGFNFSTLAGPKDAVGEQLAWTAEDMWAALENMPEGCTALPFGREDMLREMLKTFWSRLVDWDGRKCSFDGEEFRQVLAFCNQLPAEGLTYGEEAEMSPGGELMLRRFWVNNFQSMQLAGSYFPGDISLAGFPNPWGVPGSSFGINGGLAMTSAGKHKEGAWAFIRTMLLPHERTQANDYFPMDKQSFEKLAQKKQSGFADHRDKFYAGRKATQAEYDQIMALYESTDSVYRWDESLGETIVEIAGAYFAGDKALDKTAELIQNRAALYLNERK